MRTQLDIKRLEKVGDEWVERIIESVPITPEARRKWRLGSEDNITLPFNLFSVRTFKIGDYVEDELFGHFEITEEPEPPEIDVESGAHKHNLQFDREYIGWKNKSFLLTTGNINRTETHFSLTDTLYVQLEEVVRNLFALGYNYTYCVDGTTIRGYNPTTGLFEDKGTMTIPRTGVKHPNNVVNAQYAGANIFQVLTDLATAYECDWWVEGNNIVFGKCMTSDRVDFTLNQNVESISARKDENDYANRLFVYGSTKNIPDTYRKSLLFDFTSWDTSLEVNPLFNNKGYLYIATNGSLNIQTNSDKYHYSDYIPVSVGDDVFVTTYADPWEEEEMPDVNKVVLLLACSGKTGKGDYPSFDQYQVLLQKDHNGGLGQYQARITDSNIKYLIACTVDDLHGVSAQFTIRKNSNYIFRDERRMLKKSMLKNAGENHIYLEHDLEKNGRYLEYEENITFDNTCYDISGSAVAYVKLNCPQSNQSSSYTFSIRIGNAEVYRNVVQFNINEDNVYTFKENFSLSEYGISSGSKRVEVWFGFNDDIVELTSASANVEFELSNPTYEITIRKGEQFVKGIVDRFTNYQGFYCSNSFLPANECTIDACSETEDGLYLVKVPVSYYRSDYGDPSSLRLLGERRLMLPEGINYIESEARPKSQLVEKVVVFEEVYPRCAMRVSEVVAKTGVTSKITYQDGSTSSFTGTQYTIKLKRIDKVEGDVEFPFDKDYLVSDPLQVKFITPEDECKYTPDGASHGTGYKLCGMTFDVQWNQSDKSYTIAWNNQYGAQLPNDTLLPIEGDPVILSGWNVNALSELNIVSSAENELKTEGENYLTTIRDSQFAFDNRMMSDWAKENGVLPFGQKVLITSGSVVKETRVIGYELKLDLPYDTPIYTAGDTEPYSRLKELEKKLDAQTINVSSTVVAKSGSVSPGGGGGGGDVDLDAVWESLQDNTSYPNVKINISHIPFGKGFGQNPETGLMDNIRSEHSDDADRWNGKVFSDYLNQPVRTTDDVAFGKVNTNEVISNDFTTGPLGTGFRMRMSAAGVASLEIDDLTVRKTMTVYELIIQQMRHQGGIIIYSAADMECTSVEELPNGYKCYFDTKDGQVPNLFIVNDQARCQRFDLGTTTAKYYWRLVTEVGEDYIILSKNDCDTGSGVPAEGDDIIQLGHRSNTARQNAKVTTVIDGDSPRDDYYQGINSYSLVGKLITTVGVRGGQVGVFTQNGEFTGIIHLGSGSSGLTSMDEWPAVSQSIADAAQAAADAQQAASDAQDDADAAAQAASVADGKAVQAQTDANAANQRLNIWANDGYVSPEEKSYLKQQKTDIQSEYSELIASAGYYEVSTTAFQTAYTNVVRVLDYYTQATDPSTGSESITIIDDNTSQYWWGYISAYYTARKTLADAISLAAKNKAQAAQDKADSAWEYADSVNGSLDTFVNTTFENYKSSIQDQLDKKAETWVKDTDPAAAWTTSALKAEHEGDIWWNTSSSTVSGVSAGGTAVYTKSGSTYSWVETPVPQSVFDKIDGKAAIYVTWGAWGDNLQVKDVFIPSSTTTQSGVTYTKDKFYRCTSTNPVAFREIDYTNNDALNYFIEHTYADAIEDLGKQIDQKADTYYDTAAPHAEYENVPDNEDYNLWVGDLWYNSTYGKSYRYTKTAHGSNYDYTWVEVDGVPDEVYDKIDKKASIYVSKPSSYKKNDMWVIESTISASDLPSGCVAKDIVFSSADSNTFNKAHWAKKDRYTDDTYVTNWIRDTYTPAISDLQDQLDKKAQTWYQATNPASATGWVASEHVGDLWYCTADILNTDFKKDTTWYYKDNGASANPRYTWEQQNVPQAVFDKIDGKADIFISKPTSYNKYDMWVIESGLSASDMPANCQSGDIVFASLGSTTYNKAHWSKKDRYTDDSYTQNWITNTYSPFVTSIQEQVDKKADTFYLPTSQMPHQEFTNIDDNTDYNKWVGDLWHDTTVNHDYIYQKEAGTQSGKYTYSWKEIDGVPQNVYDRIDTKASIYVSKPSSYKKNDMWIIESGATPLKTGLKEGDIVFASQDSDTYNKAHWDKRDRYTDDTALIDQVNAWGRDGKISPMEKQGLKQVYADIESEYASVCAEADEYSVNHENLDDAYGDNTQGLVKLFNTILSDMTVDTSRPSNFDSLFSTYYDERDAVLQDIEAARMAKMGAADYLLDKLKNEETIMGGGLILSSYIGVKNGNTIKAAMNASQDIPGWYVDPTTTGGHGVLMIAAGVSTLSTAYTTASTRIYEDGTIITNKLYASGGGQIGGFTIDDTAIYNGKDAIDDPGDGVYVGDDGIALGDDFRVDADGELTTKKGTIGSWTLASGKLYSGSTTNYVALDTAAGTGHDYFMWAGAATAANAPYYLKRDGSIKATKGNIGSFEISSSSIGYYDPSDVDGNATSFYQYGMTFRYTHPDDNTKKNYFYINVQETGNIAVLDIQAKTDQKIAINVSSGMFTGLRPYTQYVTSSAATLDRTTFNVVINYAGTTNITLPSNAEKGQTIHVFQMNSYSWGFTPPSGHTIQYKGATYNAYFTLSSYRGLAVLVCYQNKKWNLSFHQDY